MAKDLTEWLETEVKPIKKKSIKWLSTLYFHRDPAIALKQNNEYLYSPASGVILYQKIVKPDDPIVEVKGINYTLKDAMFDQEFNEECLVIGIFMSSYDCHINRAPYSGLLSYESLPSIKSYNKPMLSIERGLEQLYYNKNEADYLFNNQRMINTIFSTKLNQSIYMISIADYDIDVIIQFCLDQNVPIKQGQKFGQIRYGSEVTLVVPLSQKFNFDFCLEDLMHVEAGIDPLVKISRK